MAENSKITVFFPHNWTLGDASEWLKERTNSFPAHLTTDELFPWCPGDADCLDDCHWTYETKVQPIPADLMIRQFPV